MPYYTGSAANMSQVRDAIVTACRAGGWSWSNEVLGKDGVSFRLFLQQERLALQGTAPSGDAPSATCIGPVTCDENPVPPLVWPVQYHVFVHPYEVYFIMRYGVDNYQWLAFGRSTLAAQLPGSGAWFGGSRAGGYRGGLSGGFGGYDTGHQYNGGYFAPVLFFYSAAAIGLGSNYIHDGFSAGWSLSQFDAAAASPLLALQPSEWTSESALIPIRSYVARPENKISLAAELEHARHISVANLEPGQIIALGNDRWMCFPWYRKAVAFSGDTTGPLGWAIRYEGP